MQSFSLSLSHTVEIKMILKSNKREDKETRIQAKEPYHLFVSAAECGDAPKKKGFFKGFWKRSRHYSLENQQPRLGSRVMGHQQRQTSRQQHHYRQHVATSALTHSACCCIVQQPRSRFVQNQRQGSRSFVHFIELLFRPISGLRIQQQATSIRG